MAGSRLIGPPAAEPLSVASMRELLRYPPTEQDTVIASLIAAARASSETYTGRAWVTQTWEQAADAWPTAEGLVLEHPPVQAIAKVTTYAPDGAAGVVLDPASYYLDAWSTPARLLFATAAPALRPAAGLVVTLTAGYGDAAAVPADVTDAIATLVLEGFRRSPPAVPLESAWPGKVLDVLRAYRVDYRPRYAVGYIGYSG